MPLNPPTSSELRAVAAELGLSLTDTELETFRGLLEETVAAYDVVDRLPDELPPVRYPRTPGHEPREEENPHNAWYVRTTIEGAPHGPLAGKRVAIKGQRLRGRSADDGRRLDPRWLRSGRRCDHRDAHPRRRRDHPRQGPLRVLLPVGKQPHRRQGPSSQSLETRLLGRRILVGWTIRPASSSRAGRARST